MGRHLAAALLSACIAAAGLISATWYVRSLEDRAIAALAPRMFDLKNQGSELQADAFRHADLLVVYGSSELESTNAYHASNVFQNYPTGFTIFPVGRGQTTSLVMLQDLAAVGSDVRGKRVAISLSPPWFFLHDRTPDFYAPNYSPLHLSALLFSTDLSFETKQMAVRQLIQTPKLFSEDPLIRFAADRLLDDTPLSRVEYLAALPLGKLKTWFMQLQDVWATYSYLRTHQDDAPPPPRDSVDMDWTGLTLRAAAEQRVDANNNDLGFENALWTEKYRKLVGERRGRFTDDWFVDNLRHTAEWADLEILLRGLADLGARPLLLSAPIAGKYYDVLGISAAARSEYYAHLREIAAAYDVPLVDFADHDDDIYFVTDPNSHLSREGWAYYDRALDAFYHGTLGELARAEWSASALLPGDSARLAAALR